jgi:hypothetical protein
MGVPRETGRPNLHACPASCIGPEAIGLLGAIKDSICGLAIFWETYD